MAVENDPEGGFTASWEKSQEVVSTEKDENPSGNDTSFMYKIAAKTLSRFFHRPGLSSRCSAAGCWRHSRECHEHIMGDPVFNGSTFRDFLFYQNQLKNQQKIRKLIENVKKAHLGAYFSRKEGHRYVTPQRKGFYLSIHKRNGLKVGQIEKFSQILSRREMLVNLNDISALRKRGHPVKTPMWVNLVQKDVQAMAV